jgi:hypothetical protein
LSSTDARPASRRELRSFGFILGAAFLLIGLWPIVVRHQPVRTWALLLAVAFAAAALVAPGLLRQVHRVWTAFGNVLGWINARIIFSVLFFVLFTPARLISILVHHDPMNRRFDPDAASYRVPRKPRPASHMSHQF